MKSKNLRCKMSDYLLPELWSKILVKLPVKYVILCTAVCKQWRSTITSPAFISDHLSLSRQNSLHFGSLLRLSQTLHRPSQSRDHYNLAPVGSSLDGLILFTGDPYSGVPCYLKTMILFNPSIRKSFTLPVPRFTFSDEDFYSYRGLGLDYATGDYKVVVIVYIWGQEHPLVQVYSLGDRSWRKVIISDNVNSMKIDSDLTQCFIHGAVHWIGCTKKPRRGHHENGILLFHMENEVFKTMALPDYNNNVEGQWFWDFYIAVVGGLLSVCVSGISWATVNRVGYTNIWVKKDYYADSWTKIASLDGKKLRVGDWLDLRSVFGDCNDFQEPPLPKFLDHKFLDNFVFSYTESLLLLEEDKAAQEVCEALEKTQLGTDDG